MLHVYKIFSLHVFLLVCACACVQVREGRVRYSSQEGRGSGQEEGGSESVWLTGRLD
jgi:hypothetical protein